MPNNKQSCRKPCAKIAKSTKSYISIEKSDAAFATFTKNLEQIKARQADRETENMKK